MSQTPIIRPLCRGLGDHVTLYTLPTERFKTARLTVSLQLPATEADAMPNKLLFSVLRRGSEAYPALSAVNRRLDELYGTTLGVSDYLHGHFQTFEMTAEFLEDRFLPSPDRDTLALLPRVMELMAQILCHPLTEPDGCLRRGVVDQEKAYLCDQLRAERNDPRTYAAERLRCIMAEGHPYGISTVGDEASIMAMTAETLTAHFRDWTHRMTCRVFYTGSASPETVAAAWQKAFAGWRPTPVSGAAIIPHPYPTSVRRVEESLSVEQGRLCMGWASGVIECETPPGGTPDDYAALLVLNELLGVMQDARLFGYVREELGLCYECESRCNFTNGILSVTCGIRSDRRAEAEAAILHVVDDLKRGHVAEEELTAAIASLVNAYRRVADDPASLEEYWIDEAVFGTHNAPETMMARVQAVTVADVVRAANRLALDTVYFLRGTRPASDDGSSVGGEVCDHA